MVVGDKMRNNTWHMYNLVQIIDLCLYFSMNVSFSHIILLNIVYRWNSEKNIFLCHNEQDFVHDYKMLLYHANLIKNVTTQTVHKKYGNLFKHSWALTWILTSFLLRIPTFNCCVFVWFVSWISWNEHRSTKNWIQ